MHDRHRGPWHYINYVYAPDGDHRGVPDPVEDWKPGQEPANVVQALKWAQHQLTDTEISDTEKAIALCWYLHLLGDIHQPLHAVTLVTDKYPQGDRGGNLVRVNINGSEQNLHSWLDGRLGGYRSGPTIDRVVETTLKENPEHYITEWAKPASPEELARESLLAAKQWVYAAVIIEGRSDGLDELYFDFAALMSRRRIAQAGHRMGAALCGLLDKPAK